jgi:hypothetical protein
MPWYYPETRPQRLPLTTPVRPATTGGGAPTGPAGGDLTGTYPAPTIAAGAVGNAEITDVAWGKVTSVPAGLVNWRDGWQSEQAYAQGDAVIHNGSSWIANAAIPAPAALNIANYAEVAFDPRTLTQADGSEVLSWTNQGSAGAALDASAVTGRAPLYYGNVINGEAALRFSNDTSATAQTFTTANLPMTNMVSFLAVVRFTSTSSYPLMGVIGTSGNIEFRGYTNLLQPEMFWGGARTTSPTALALNAWHIVEGIYAGGNVSIYVDGALMISQARAAYTPTAKDFAIGSRPAGTNRFLGDMAGIIVVTHDLANSDRQLLEGQMAWRFDLVANLPVDHPYKTTAPVAVYEPGVDPRWERMAAGVVPGGTAAQVLQKATGSDYDVAWTTPAALAYRHVQATAATTWSITHNLSFRPNVAAVDSTGREIVPGAVDYPSATAVTLTFSAAVGGEAYLS